MVFNLANENFDKSPVVDLKIEALSITKLIKDFKILKINRQANMVSHEIEKFSFDNRSNGVLLNSVPPCVEYAVMNDFMNIFN